MSNLLDQAIIDAEALKEVAKKNAEATILEKFSDQIKEAVEQILDEQPEDEGAEEMEAAELEGGDVLDQLEPASAEGVEMCPCPDIKDNVSVTVDLPSLEAELDGMPSPEESEKVADADMADAAEDDLELPSLEDSLEEEFEIDESSLQEFVFESAEPSTELNLEEELLEELMGMLEEDSGDAVGDALGSTKDYGQALAGEMGGEQSALDATNESLEINQSELEEVVEEALTVDIDPLNSLQSGHGPAPNAVFELAEEQLLAMLQDSENKEKHEAMQKALKDLQESNGRLTTDLEKLSSDKKELIKIVSKVKNRLEESNLTNAKLLYTNKVLMSDSLNERQRNKIVEALSNSESVEEAKVIYETLQSATGSTIENKKPESLSEAMNKTTSTLILSHRKRDREKTTQDDSSLTRWKILAGLNNK